MSGFHSDSILRGFQSPATRQDDDPSSSRQRTLESNRQRLFAHLEAFPCAPDFGHFCGARFRILRYLNFALRRTAGQKKQAEQYSSHDHDPCVL